MHVHNNIHIYVYIYKWRKRERVSFHCFISFVSFVYFYVSEFNCVFVEMVIRLQLYEKVNLKEN